MSRFLRVIILLALLPLLSGCGGEPSAAGRQQSSTGTAESQEQTYVADFGSFPVGYKDIGNITVSGELLYFTGKIQKQSREDEETALFQWDVLNHKEPAPLTDMVKDGVTWIAFFADDEGNFYGYGWRIREQTYHIYQIGEASIVQLCDVTDILKYSGDAWQVMAGGVDAGGNFYLLAAGGGLYIISPDGTLINQIEESGYGDILPTGEGSLILV